MSEAIVYRVKRGEEKRREEWVWLGREMVFMRKRLWFWVRGHTPAKRKRGLTNGKERKKGSRRKAIAIAIAERNRIEKIVCYCWVVLLS